MLQDVRHALRSLLHTPGFTTPAVLTLAIGIAANTLVFTLLNSLALRPMPVRDPGRVVRIFPVDANGRRQNLFSYGDYQEYRAQASSFGSLVGYIPVAVTARVQARDAEDVVGYAVSSNYFSVLGIEPSLGRMFLPSEERAGAASTVAVISDSLWRRRFAGDPGVLGTTIVLNERAFTVVGVGPERFMGTEPLSPDIWVPIGAQPIVVPGADLLNDRRSGWLLVAGRLAPGVSRRAAETRLSVVARRLAATYTAPNRPVSLVVMAGTFFTLDPGLRPLLLLVLTIVGLVLAIASANVGNLVLARTTARQREMAVRLALGATRWRIVRQLVTETLVISAIGGAAGLLLSVWGLRLLYPLALSLVPSEWGRVVLDLTPDVRVFAYTAGMALAAGIGLGIVPAWQATTPHVSSALHDDGAMLGLRVARSRVRHALVVFQIAVCMVLLVAAGLLTRGLQRTHSLDLGFNTDGVVFTEYDLRRHGYTPAKAADFNQSLIDFAQRLPGVTAVALTSHVPLHGGVTRTDVHPEGVDRLVNVTITTVSPDYFRALAIPLTAGRLFSPQESNAGVPVAVISDALAARFWPGLDPVGRTLATDGSGGPLTIVGVVHDTSSASLWRDKEMALYRTLGSADSRRVQVLVRATRDVSVVAGALRERARTLDARVTFSATPLEALLRLWILPSRIAAIAATVLGLIALLLASVGIYGVLAYAVRHRTREIGIRMALGANRRDVMRLILRDGWRLIALGVSVGLAAAVVAGQVLSRFIFDVSRTDLVTFSVVPLFLCAVASAACYLPARRASRVEPLVALRTL
jgi:predicted permease